MKDGRFHQYEFVPCAELTAFHCALLLLLRGYVTITRRAQSSQVPLTRHCRRTMTTGGRKRSWDHSGGGGGWAETISMSVAARAQPTGAVGRVANGVGIELGSGEARAAGLSQQGLWCVARAVLSSVWRQYAPLSRRGVVAVALVIPLDAVAFNKLVRGSQVW